MLLINLAPYKIKQFYHTINKGWRAGVGWFGRSRSHFIFSSGAGAGARAL